MFPMPQCYIAISYLTKQSRSYEVAKGGSHTLHHHGHHPARAGRLQAPLLLRRSTALASGCQSWCSPCQALLGCMVCHKPRLLKAELLLLTAAEDVLCLLGLMCHPATGCLSLY
jgi:hypothetical protein